MQSLLKSLLAGVFLSVAPATAFANELGIDDIPQCSEVCTCATACNTPCRFSRFLTQCWDSLCVDTCSPAWPVASAQPVEAPEADDAPVCQEPVKAPAPELQG
ncbi:hypothetical protein [Corallococcus exercitus]|uniref:Uncharacterized protein n=1 Tax=Corallococcus exercitus TaxID=2316736 RepID=A0A7Y4NCL2_9BACT|nr:hypothetical protein [Corallococcus exercitus]NOK08979.1 hypothetical protein [Corallococcus exercitus]